MKTPKSKSIYKLVQRFADITKIWIIQGKIKRVEKCLQIANTLFTTGNAAVRNAIANVYIYTLSSVLDSKNEQSRQVMVLLPFALRSEYEHQVSSLGV